MIPDGSTPRQKERYRKVCRAIRGDGAYLFAGGKDYALVENLAGNPSALGAFGYSFPDQNRNLIEASRINGDRANAQNIPSGRYGLARPLYIYVKENRVSEVPGLREYVEEFTNNEWTIRPDGYLTEGGLIPLPKEDRKKNYYIARSPRRFLNACSRRRVKYRAGLTPVHVLEAR